MKKILLILTILTATIFTGCTSTQVKEDKTPSINLYGVSNEEERETPQLSKGDITTENFKMNVTFTEDAINISVTNTSNEVIVVDWNFAEYTGLDGKDQKIFNMKEKDSGMFIRQRAIPLRPLQSYTAEIVPIDNLKFEGGSSSGVGTIYIESPLFSKELGRKRFDYAKLSIPITVKGVKKGELRHYDLFFGRGEKPEGLDINGSNNKIEASVVAPVVAPVVQESQGEKDIAKPVAQEANTGSSKLKEIVDENNTLQSQLDEKDRMIEELNRKIKLKDSLKRKDQEIERLMKQLNE